jgi:hypothetical protein
MSVCEDVNPEDIHRIFIRPSSNLHEGKEGPCYY